MPKPKIKDFSSRCQVCNHADCGTINLALARGLAVPIIKAKFPTLSIDSLYRHFHNHISGPVMDRLRVKSLAGIVGKNLNLAELTASENQSILAQIVALKSSLLGMIQQAERADAGTTFSSLCGRLTDVLALETRVLGMVQTGSTTTVHNYIQSDNFILIRAMLMEEIRAYPDLAKRISRRLLAIEAKPVEVVDAEVKTIESGSPREAETVAAASATDERGAPAIIRLETATSGATT